MNMKSIDICADEKQWKDVDNIVVLPVEFPSENNIRNIKVTSDSDYVYMLIECVDVISFFIDSKWMNIYIGFDKHQYSYVINRRREVECMGMSNDHLGIAQIENYHSDKQFDSLQEDDHIHVHLHHDAVHGGVRNTSLGSAQYTVSGKYMQVQIARSDIGLYGENTPEQFYFTVTDGVDSPEGYFSYLYKIGG